MLIEFSVTNFRSFRERVTFSMVAAPKIHRKGNVFTPASAGERFPPLLKVAVIYGPNASGKSNLLQALDMFSTVVSRNPVHSYPLPISPFRFDPDLQEKPSVFEVHFIQEGLRYSYELHATADRIVVERLTAFPGGKEQLLYNREHIKSGDVYQIGSMLEKEAGKDVVEAWKKLTSPRTAFIAQAVANSSEDIKVLRAPFTWLRDGMRTVLSGMEGIAELSQNLAEKPWQAESLARFLQDVDVPISKITVKKIKVPARSNEDIEIGNQSRHPVKEVTHTFTTLTHKTALGEGDISFHDESEGTKNLIGFWLPWSIRTPSPSGMGGGILVVDEMDSSLHPKIVTSLVKKHVEMDVDSQLIFSTHDTHLMDAKLLRRDQFWITERDMNGATNLRSIHDFEGRESEDIEKRYFEGRYRGLPFTRV